MNHSTIALLSSAFIILVLVQLAVPVQSFPAPTIAADHTAKPDICWIDRMLSVIIQNISCENGTWYLRETPSETVQMTFLVW